MASNGSINRQVQREYWRTLPYFHENFTSTEEVSSFIRSESRGRIGSFLLRPSNRNRDLLTISVIVPDHSVRHTHIHIEAVGDVFQYFVVVEKKFSTIEKLVSYYHENPVKNLENVSNVFFRNAIHRTDVNEHLYLTSQPPSRTSSTLSLNSSASFNWSTHPPPLPIRPRTRSNESRSAFMHSDDSSNDLSNDSIADRPPLPLPASVNNNSGGSVLYYSQARNVDEDISERLKAILKNSDQCECGIPRHLADLPMGWTVHLSRDPFTRGKLFYQSEEGVTTWQLPQEIEMQLTNIHHCNLRKIDRNWRIRRVSETPQQYS